MRSLLANVSFLLVLVSTTFASSPQRILRVAVLDFGAAPFGKQVAQQFRANLRTCAKLQLIDSELSNAAAQGVGYSGSLNMSVSEARDLGAAMDADFYIIGDAQTLRRSSSSKPVYYESYSTLFVISSRTGSLVYWDRIASESDTAFNSEKELNKILTAPETTQRASDAMRKADFDEAKSRSLAVVSNVPLIEEAPEDDQIASAQGLRLPRPYRRLRPTYPESAARAEVEATVDVLVDIGADGEVGQIQVARWAGFGLDETTIATVRLLHFFPAMRNGSPIPMRVLLRYNFRKPAQ